MQKGDLFLLVGFWTIVRFVNRSFISLRIVCFAGRKKEKGGNNSKKCFYWVFCTVGGIASGTD